MKDDNKITKTFVPPNFIYPDIPESAYRFGSGQLVGTPLRENGNWIDYLPPEEEQRQHGVESSACFVEASQHSLATIQEEQFDLPDQNYSARFNALLSNGSVIGGNPLIAGDSFRHDGLIPEDMMPFGEEVSNWNEYHSWKGVDEQKCRATGLKWLEDWQPNYDLGFTREEPAMSKYIKLREILKYCPPAVSVTAWYEQNGVYIKPAGMSDNHLVLLVYIDELNRPYIWDTYTPHLKILEPYFNFDFCVRWSLTKKEKEVVKDNWLVDLLKRLLEFFKDLWKWL